MTAISSGKKSSYYGIFFWLSLASFVVPLFVGIYAIQAAAPAYTKPEPNPNAAGVDHALWDYLLKRYVSEGKFDYAGMERDYLFTTYLRQLNQAEIDKLETEDERLALLCNAYNAFVVHGVISHDITDNVMKYKAPNGKGFFDVEEHILGGETMSLNHLEHGIIRVEYDEPRIHMALVCAAISCPAIRPEAYVGAHLDRQLEDQAVQFANNPNHVSVENNGDVVELSAILKWYGQDWGSQDGYLKFLEERAKDEDVRQALAAARAGDVEVAFKNYDWTLNTTGDTTQTASGGGGGGGEFGSGSIPNE